MSIPQTIKLLDIMAAVERDNNEGFCLACGILASGVEPDARGYKCDACGELGVYGAEEILIQLFG
jgi:hypothetical protein